MAAQAVRDLAVGDAQLQFERQRRSDSEARALLHCGGGFRISGTRDIGR